MFQQPVACLVSTLVLALCAQGGSAASLSGRVEDVSGGAIAGALIVVVCPGEARSAHSDDAGRFEFSELPAARCSVSGAHPHFSTTLVNVDLTAQVEPAIRLVLPVHTLEESVAVTPGRGARRPVEAVPSGLSILTGRELASRPYYVLPQALREEPGVAVQQTTAAAGSPIIRGFTGQSNVYLVDGVRLNTSAWRSGPSQYLAWLAPDTAERIEVVRGPMSVLYGSDALGGAINVVQARPPFSAAGLRLGGVVDAQVGTSQASAALAASLIVQAPSAAMSVSGSRRSSGDLRPGGGRDSHAAVTRFLGLPSRPGRLPGTAYDQWGGHVIGQARVGRSALISGFYRRDEQRQVQRYDRIDGGEGFFRSDIAPQRLDLAALRYERASLGPFQGFRLTLSLNRQQDGTREQVRAGARLDTEKTATTAIGYQGQVSRGVGGHTATLGFEAQDERIAAGRWQQTPAGVTAVRPLIPDGTEYRSAAVFGQMASREIAGRVWLRAGARVNGATYRAVAAPVFGVSPERVGMGAVSFDASAGVRLSPGLRGSLAASRGFRAANASDLGAIGLSGGGGFEIAPAVAAGLGAFIGSSEGPDAVATGQRAGGLRPESVYAFEGALRYTASRLSASAILFDLELFDSIQRRTIIFDVPVVGTIISGQEIVRQDEAGRAYVAVDTRPIATRANAGRGRIRGLEVEGLARLGRWTSRAWFSMAAGRHLDTGGFLRRMPPAMGGAAFAWQRGPDALRLEGVLAFARPQTRLAPGDLADARIGGRRTAGAIAAFFGGRAVDLGLVRNGVLVPTGETLAQVQARLLQGATASVLYDRVPGWVTFSARAVWPVHRRVDLILIGENLTDRNYRLVGSGVDAAGAGLQARLRLRF